MILFFAYQILGVHIEFIRVYRKHGEHSLNNLVFPDYAQNDFIFFCRNAILIEFCIFIVFT